MLGRVDAGGVTIPPEMMSFIASSIDMASGTTSRRGTTM